MLGICDMAAIQNAVALRPSADRRNLVLDVLVSCPWPRSGTGPVLPVSDVLSALDNYARLSFAPNPTNVAKSWRAGAWSKCCTWFRLPRRFTVAPVQVSGIDPVTNLSEVYLIDDANALHEQWVRPARGGRRTHRRTEYGLCGEPTSIPMETRCYGSWLAGYPKPAQT